MTTFTHCSIALTKQAIEVLLSNKELQSGETGEAGWLAVGLKLEEEQYVGIHLNSSSPSI